MSIFLRNTPGSNSSGMIEGRMAKLRGFSPGRWVIGELASSVDGDDWAQSVIPLRGTFHWRRDGLSSIHWNRRSTDLLSWPRRSPS